jgi:hypothetical protein
MTAPDALTLAKQWASHTIELAKLQQQFDALKRQMDAHRSSQEDRTKELRALIGPNVPHRFFNIGEGKVVMVSVARGVELVEVEQAGANA